MREAHQQSISVVMPARNASATIGETLDSLCAQTWPSWQATVIVNGSTDSTRAIAERYAARDERISVIESERSGVGAARNAGLAASDGDWILFLDADDTIHPEMMQRGIGKLEENPRADAVHCGWTLTDETGNVLSHVNGPPDGVENFFEIAGRYCPFIHPFVHLPPLFPAHHRRV